jgi:glycosyltransferase involved in cell wall biosynthesis
VTIALHYPCHNRRQYVEATFAALLEYTNWDIVDRLHITDDRSRDGTYEMLCELTRDVPVPVTVVTSNFGGPVAAMNHVLDRCVAEVIAKIDSDVLVCPRWLDVMSNVLEANPNIDALGMEPGFGEPVAPLEVSRRAKPAPFIGGVGLIRTRVFRKHRPKQDNRFFGWTQFQRSHVRAAWCSPDLPVFLLDHIHAEPWKYLAQTYIARGWSRSWSAYFDPPSEYFAWWTKKQMAIA